MLGFLSDVKTGCEAIAAGMVGGWHTDRRTNGSEESSETHTHEHRHTQTHIQTLTQKLDLTQVAVAQGESFQ